jgi:hypothetical protein
MLSDPVCAAGAAGLEVPVLLELLHAATSKAAPASSGIAR